MGMEGRTAVRPSGITPDFHAAFKQTWYQLHPARASQCRRRPKKGPEDQQRHQEKADSSQNQEGHKASSAHTKTAESTYSRPKPRGRLNAKPSACAETAPTTAFLARLGAPPVPSRTGFPEGVWHPPRKSGTPRKEFQRKGGYSRKCLEKQNEIPTG